MKNEYLREYQIKLVSAEEAARMKIWKRSNKIA